MLQNLLAAREARRSEDGFTLIELLIVIVVLGILAGIVVFGVGTFRADSQAAACAANKKIVETAAEARRAKDATGGTAYPSVATLVADGYLKTAPVPTLTMSTAGVISGC